MKAILVVATILGGIAAIWFFYDKLFSKNWGKQDKIVNNNWLESSELKKSMEQKGYSLSWSNADRVNERKQKGYVVIIEEGRKNRIKYVFRDKSGAYLMGKK